MLFICVIFFHWTCEEGLVYRLHKRLALAYSLHTFWKPKVNLFDCRLSLTLIPYSSEYLISQGNKHNECFLSPTQCGKMASVLLRCAFLFDVCVVIWQTYVGCNAADCLNNQHLLPINSHWRRNFLGLRVAVWRLLSVVIIVETFIQICELRFVSLCIKYNWCDLIGLLLKYIDSWQHFSILNIHIDLLPLIYTKM